MAIELRKTGISVVGDIPWGAHFCYFYETKQDLLDILVPYFKTGLENKEFCLWVISSSELLTVQEVTSSLRNALPDLDRHLAERSIEVVGHDDWFLSGGVFDPHNVANRFRKKLEEALARGYAGMRVNGSPAWLHKTGQKVLPKFEAELDKLFPNERTIASCTYPLASIGAHEIFDVVRTHQFAIARRQGEWEVIETPELIQAKAEIKRLNEELEQRVVERTGQPGKAIAELTYEISARQQSEVELSLAHQRLSYHFENTPLAVIEWDKDLFIKRWSKRAEEVFGWQASEALGINMYDPDFRIVYEEDAQPVEEIAGQLIKGTVHRNLSLNRNYTKDGNVIYCEWYNSVLRDEDGNVITILSLVHDVTERKHAEDELRRQKEILQQIFDRIPVMISFVDADGRIKLVNREWERSLGWSLEEIRQQNLDIFAECYPDPRYRQDVLNFIAASKGDWADFKTRVRDGRVMDTTFCRVLLSDGTSIGIGQDITERKRAEEQLKVATEQLRALSASLESAREEEGTRIARELHDELGAALTSLRWSLDEIDNNLAATITGQSDAFPTRSKIAAMTNLVESTLNTVRRISSELRPSMLDDLGLVAAIEWLAQNFQERTGITCRCYSSLEHAGLNREQSTAVFRILQEALTNVLRHAQATRVDIKIEKQHGYFAMAVRDNGKGITEREKLGILGMRERAHLIGAEIEIKGARGKGTVVIVRVPASGADRQNEPLV